MSFQQGGGLGGRREVWSDGGGGRGGGVAPDAHTPTLTNYHCAAENVEEVQTGRAQMRQFVSFCPQRQKAQSPPTPPSTTTTTPTQGRGTVQVITWSSPPLNSALPRQALFGASGERHLALRAGPITRGKTIRRAVALAATGYSFPRPPPECPLSPPGPHLSSPPHAHRRPITGQKKGLCVRRGVEGAQVPSWVDCRRGL